MIFDSVDWLCLFTVCISKMIWLATNRAKNFAGIEVHSLKMSLNGLFVRLLVNSDSGMVYSLCQLEKVCINNLKVRAFT